MSIEKYRFLFTPITEGLPEKGEKVYAIDFDDKITLTDVVDRYGFVREYYTHWLDLASLTTKHRAIKFANEMSNDILVDSFLTKRINNSNDIARHIIKNKDQL